MVTKANTRFGCSQVCKNTHKSQKNKNDKEIESHYATVLTDHRDKQYTCGFTSNKDK